MMIIVNVEIMLENMIKNIIIAKYCYIKEKYGSVCVVYINIYMDTNIKAGLNSYASNINVYKQMDGGEEGFALDMLFYHI